MTTLNMEKTVQISDFMSYVVSLVQSAIAD